MEVFELIPEFGTLLIFSLVLLTIYLYKSTCYPQGFPPGPKPWPIVGNIYQFKGKLLPKLFMKYREKYGDIVGFKLAQNNAIVLNSLESIKEALVEKSDIFTSRPDTKRFYLNIVNTLLKTKNPGGVVWQNGYKWRDMRRFTLMSLRDFGVGKATIEQRIQEEARFVCDIFSKSDQKPFDYSDILMEAVSNIICSVCFGSRFEYSDPQFKLLVESIKCHFKGLSHTRALNFFPFLRFSPTQSWFWQYLDSYKQLQLFLNEKIDKHRESFDPNAIRDFVDHYLVKETQSKKEDTFSRSSMLKTIIDIMAAGTDTTSTTISWFILYLLHHPDIQNKCHKELDTVVGSGRQVALADRPSLPYLDAFIHEVQRLSTIAPLGVPHCANKNTTLAGYTIPQGTVVYPNIYAVHHDATYWEDPETLKPERWLNTDGKFQKNQAFIIFGDGPRHCLGEIMARAELFLFLGSFLQQFIFKAVDEKNLPSLETKMGVVLKPVPYKVIVCPR